MLGDQLGQAQLGDLRDLRGGPVRGAHRQHDGGTQVDGDARVDGQLAGAGDVGVVTAHDDDGIARVGNVVVALDDLGDGAVEVFVQALVTDTDAVLVVQAGGGMAQQQLQDVVATVLSGAGDRPEDADLGDGRRQPRQDAERDGGLAGVTFG